MCKVLAVALQGSAYFPSINSRMNFIACFASPALHTKVHIGSSSYANWVSMLSGQITSVFNDTSC